MRRLGRRNTMLGSVALSVRWQASAWRGRWSRGQGQSRDCRVAMSGTGAWQSVPKGVKPEDVRKQAVSRKCRVSLRIYVSRDIASFICFFSGGSAQA